MIKHQFSRRGYTCKICHRWVNSKVEFRLLDEHPEWVEQEICWRHQEAS